MDIVSNLPSSIIETILCLLPIQEAARTSILSSEWRYRWIKIPKIAFIENAFQVSTDETELSVLEQSCVIPNERKEINKKCKFIHAINHVLTMHEGPIHEFTLSIETDDSWIEIEHIISQLVQKNTVKKLALNFLCGGYQIPSSLFSLHQLTDLCLVGCYFDHQPLTFDGFDRLTSLSLQEVFISNKTLLHLLSNCPLLKTLDISTYLIQGSDNCTIINLFECLPVIENLSILLASVECFGEDGIPQELPNALVHMRYLYIGEICFIHKYGLPILALLMRSSPKLEKLKLKILDDSWVEKSDRSDHVTPEDYSDIWLEHLKELEIENMIYRETELDFVKLVLAKSPVLKKVRIFIHEEVGMVEQMQIVETLLDPPRASLEVQIIVEIGEGSHTGSRSVM